MSTQLAPVSKERAKIFKAMTVATQEVARELAERLGGGTRGITLVQYDVGTRVANIPDDEATYGSEAIKQLALYLNIPGGETTLYALRAFANTFEKDFVKEYSARQMSNGGYMELKHWLVLSRVEGKGEQKRMLERIFSESLSANDLARELQAGAAKTTHARQGGRKPTVPSSPIGALQKLFTTAQTLGKLEPYMEKSLFDKLDEIDADAVNKGLLDKLQKTLKTVEDTRDKCGDAVVRLTGNIARVEKVLAKKYEKGLENYEAGEKGHAGNGKPKAKAKKKPKNKARKPVAATV